jgi:hypothetical protein
MKKLAKKEIGPIYQLKISLDDIKPPIWRRVLMPASIPLAKLHQLIQLSMGWDNSHLHAFQVGMTTYGDPHPDLDDWMENQRGVTLSQIAPAEKSKVRYEYDFGDGWVHTLLVEKILPPEDGMTYPLCLTGKRSCPPEDCGGPWGYADFLEALADPKHKQHTELVEWVGEDFNPAAFDLAGVNAKLKKLRV